MQNEVNTTEVNLFEEVETYMAHIREDYFHWMARSDTDNKPHIQTMIEDFNAGLRYEDGKKFIKVITGNSVHSFIMKDNDGKFRKGDILKAASWKAPAKNFARGNIANGTEYRVQWTGAL